MTITVEQMRGQLLTLDQVRERLATTEPLTAYPFVAGNAVRFTVEPGWQHGISAKQGHDEVAAQFHLGKGSSALSLPLTKEAILTAVALTGLGRAYVTKIPAHLTEDQLNHWYHDGGMDKLPGKARDLQVIVLDGKAIGFTRSTFAPFSNLRLLDETLAGIGKRHGSAEVLADYKFTHGFNGTRLRLILAGHTRRITGTDVDDDTWSVGLQLSHSQLGGGSPRLDGYLFRWWCTNGAINTRANSAAVVRRGGSLDDVYATFRSTVDGVLGELEGSLDEVQQLTTIPVEGSLSEFLRDVFERFHVPVADRTKIIEAVGDIDGPISMYAVMAAITQAANDGRLEPSTVERLLNLGGNLAHHARQRCDGCQRLLTHTH